MLGQKLAFKLKFSGLLVYFSFICVLFLILRNMGLYPLVFGDEYTYNKFSRLAPLRDAEIPGYLYLGIYKITNLCGDGFLNCARVLNVIFFCSAGIFIYLIGKKITSEKNAGFIAILSLVGPINSYTTYFMPESLYFLFFWVFTYLLLKKGYVYWLLSGSALGLLSLIKPHALFLLPALAIYLLLSAWRSKNEQKFGYLAKQYFSFFLMVLFVKLSLGFLFANKSGLTLFGTSYTSFASSTLSSLVVYVDLFKRSWFNLLGHLLSLSLLFSVAVASALLLLKEYFTSKKEITLDLALYTILILFSLIFVVAVFTIAVEDEFGVNRLHLRYYNFAFPLLYLTAFGHLSRNIGSSSLKMRLIISIPITIAIIYASYTRLSPYVSCFVDNPELRAFTSKRFIFYVFSAMSLATLILWVYKVNFGLRLFLYVFIPLVTTFSVLRINKELRQLIYPKVYDQIGIFARNYFVKDDLDKVALAGSPGVGIFHTAFYLDSYKNKMDILSTGSSYDMTKFPPGYEWLLLIGDHKVVNSQVQPLKFNGFTLVKSEHALPHVDFSKHNNSPFINSLAGLSEVEYNYRWSIEPTVAIEFTTPLPKKFKLCLVGHAIGPNINKEFVVTVGANSNKFSLEKEDAEKIISLDNPAALNILSIKVPLAISAQELGMDTTLKELGLKREHRLLGMALKKIWISL